MLAVIIVIKKSLEFNSNFPFFKEKALNSLLGAVMKKKGVTEMLFP